MVSFEQEINNHERTKGFINCSHNLTVTVTVTAKPNPG